MPHTWGLYYMHSEIGQKSGPSKSKINVVTKFNDAHRLFGICTTCQCSLSYRQSSLRRCYRSKSGGNIYYRILPSWSPSGP